MAKTLLDKVWDLHRVRSLRSGQDQIFVGLHLVHEVSSPQAFTMLRHRNLKVLYPSRTFATVDHILPTTDPDHRPYQDSMADAMVDTLERNVRDFGIKYFGRESLRQGIVHVIGPELGLTQPGMIVACGDSHTSTHGALGCVAFGIGTSQVRDILATQCIAMKKPKIRRIEVKGKLNPGVYSKDIILKIISELGIKGGVGYAYEYGGEAIRARSIEERMTICNMSIEGGARIGYVNPDEKTFEYLQNRPYAPTEAVFESAKQYWRSMASDSAAMYDDVFELDVSSLEPMVTWGTNPGQAVGVTEVLPSVPEYSEHIRSSAEKAYAHMGFRPGDRIIGTKIDVAFLGSCTNSRISDLREAAGIVAGKRVARSVRAIVVPGSQRVARQAQEEGLIEIFENSGFEWREPGCSMCLGLNPDQLRGSEMCASSSNRNFIGRQGSPNGRTLLMSPAMVAAAGIVGEVIDVRETLRANGKSSMTSKER